jgi:hypothetical protein
VDVQLPSHRDITRSVNAGRPIALDAGSAAAKAFAELADLYRGPRGKTLAKPKVVQVKEAPVPAAPTVAFTESDSESRPRKRLLRSRSGR